MLNTEHIYCKARNIFLGVVTRKKDKKKFSYLCVSFVDRIFIDPSGWFPLENITCDETLCFYWISLEITFHFMKGSN